MQQTITRKIAIMPGGSGERRKITYDTLASWRTATMNIYNILLTQRLCLDMSALMTSVKEEALRSVRDGVNGILQKPLSTISYKTACDIRMLPSDILSNINRLASDKYRREQNNILTGKKSMGNATRKTPIPFSGISPTFFTSFISTGDNGKKTEVFSMKLFKMNFILRPGKENIQTRLILRSLAENKTTPLCSSLWWDTSKKKWFLLLRISINELPGAGSYSCRAFLFNNGFVINACFDDCSIGIGEIKDMEEERREIRLRYRKLQKSIRLRAGGKGYAKKLAALQRFHEKERHTTITRLHQITAKFITLSRARAVGKVSIIMPKKEEMTEDDKYEGGNSFSRLRDMITYKCNINGIALS